MSLLHRLKSLSKDVESFSPASEEVIAKAEESVGNLPPPLRLLLQASNGLVCRSFRLYSAFDPQQPKKTWESLQRANDASKTGALGADPKLLERFLVFSDIGGGYALLDRMDASIWFQENGIDEVRQTTLTFDEFLETMVRNAE